MALLALEKFKMQIEGFSEDFLVQKYLVNLKQELIQ